MRHLPMKMHFPKMRQCFKRQKCGFRRPATSAMAVNLQTPLTPQKVWKAIQEARAAKASA
jgi:hypothetical protein